MGGGGGSGEGELGGQKTCGLGRSPYRLPLGPALREVWCPSQGRGGAPGLVSCPFVSFHPASSPAASLSSGGQQPLALHWWPSPTAPKTAVAKPLVVVAFMRGWSP